MAETYICMQGDQAVLQDGSSLIAPLKRHWHLGGMRPNVSVEPRSTRGRCRAAYGHYQAFSADLVR